LSDASLTEVSGVVVLDGGEDVDVVSSCSGASVEFCGEESVEVVELLRVAASEDRSVTAFVET